MDSAAIITEPHLFQKPSIPLDHTLKSKHRRSLGHAKNLLSLFIVLIFYLLTHSTLTRLFNLFFLHLWTSAIASSTDMKGLV